MTVQELLENAQLDALGLLDEREREDFERAFWAAPPGLQTQIRREQARLCKVETLLPDAAPREELRQLVLASIRQAQVAGTTEPAEAPVAHEASPRFARPLPMARVSGVSGLWRAGAIGFATAAVVLGAAFLRVKGEFDKQQASLGDEAALIAWYQQNGGAQYLSDMLVGSDSVRVVMKAQDGAVGQVAVFNDPNWDSVKLYCKNMVAPRGSSLHVVAMGPSGKLVDIAELPSKPGLSTMTIAKSKIPGGDFMQLAVVSTPLGKDVADSQVLFKFA